MVIRLLLVVSNSFSQIYNLLTSDKRKAAVRLFGLIIIGTALEVLGVGLILPVIAFLTNDNLPTSYPVLQPLINALGNPDHETQIQIIMIVLIVTYFIKNLYLAFLAVWQARFKFDLQVELAQRLFTIYINQPYTFHLQRNSAHLFRNVTSEVNEVIGRGVSPIMNLFAEIIILLSIIFLLILVEPVGAIIVFSVLLAAAWIFHKITYVRLKLWGEKRLYHDGLRVQHLNQGFNGIKDIKLFGRQAEFISQVYEHTSKAAQMTKFLSILQQLPRLWLEILAMVGLALLVLIMLAQENEISNIVPVMGLFAAAAFRLMPSVNRIITNVQLLHYGAPAIKNLSKDFQLPVPVLEEKESIYKNTKFKKEICLYNINYRYPETSNPSLESITLTIKKGETVGLIGPSGSGKSTITDIILGLLIPESGEVLVDGESIHNKLRSWQEQVGYVPQSIYLTDDSLRRNIAFGLPPKQIDDAAVSRAIHAAQLEEFVSSLPEGINTIVGERGVRLSGGQRQRIGIARALYHDPDILVLDEATSALDNETEKDVMQSVLTLHGKKTIIIVAHRLSTIENCDKVYLLELGKIVGEGTPTEIVTNKKKSDF